MLLSGPSYSPSENMLISVFLFSDEKLFMHILMLVLADEVRDNSCLHPSCPLAFLSSPQNCCQDKNSAIKVDVGVGRTAVEDNIYSFILHLGPVFPSGETIFILTL